MVARVAAIDEGLDTVRQFPRENDAACSRLPSRGTRVVSNSILHLTRPDQGESTEHTLEDGEICEDATAKDCSLKNTDACRAERSLGNDHVDGLSTAGLDDACLPTNAHVSGESLVLLQDYWHHSILFLFPRDMEPTYAPIGISDSDEHPGKPASMPFYIAAPLNFAYTEPATYFKHKPTPTPTPTLTLHRVVDVAKTLHHLNPVYDDGTAFEKQTVSKHVSPRQRKCNFSHQCKDYSVALIAQALLNASAELFVSVVPVRLEFRIHEPSTFAICHYGLAITLTSGLQTILPLCLWMFGGKITRSKSNETTPHRRQWDRQEFPSLVDKFLDAPILRCTDVVLVITCQNIIKRAQQ